MAKDDEQLSSKSGASKPHASTYDDPSSPFFIHHSDQPGLVLVAQLLTQENYPIWSHEMLMALITKNKDGFIDGTITKPLTGSVAETKQWTRCNTLVKGWLLNSISPNIAHSVMYNDNANEIWNELKERFSQTNSVHLFHIEQDIHACVQGDMGVGAYYTKLKGLWDLRDALCPLPSCSGDTAKGLYEYQQKQRTIKFLMGLNGVYTAARGQILLMEPLPTVNKVHSLIIQDEKQRLVSSQSIGKEPETAAFAVQVGSRSSNPNYPPKNPHLKCTRCDAIGHTSDTCRAHLKCDYCGWKGHTIDICRKLKKATSNGNKGNYQDKKNTSPGVFPKAHHIDSQPGIFDASPPSYTLTAEQYHQVLAILDRNQSSPIANQVSTTSTASNLSGPTFGEDDWDGN